MTSQELREELRKTEEKEKIQNVVEEYIRIRKIVEHASADMTYDECCAVAQYIATDRGVFNMGRPF